MTGLPCLVLPLLRRVLLHRISVAASRCLPFLLASALVNLTAIADEALVSSSHSGANLDALYEEAYQLYSAGQFEEAKDRARFAQHTIHRDEGVHSVSQIPFLKILNDISLQAFDIDAVTTGHKFITELNARHYGDSHGATSESVGERVSWHQAIGDYASARLLLEEQLSKDLESGQSLSRLQNLLAANQYLEGRCCSEELTTAAFESMVNDPQTDFGEIKQAEYQKATFDVMSDRPPTLPATSHINHRVLGLSRQDRVVRAYSDIDEISTFNDVPNGATQGYPLSFCGAALSTFDDNLEEVKIRAEIDISTTGRMDKLRIIESNATAKLERLFKRIARVSRYMPHIENGEPKTSTLKIEQIFTPKPKAGGSNTMEFAQSEIANIHACHRVAQLHKPLPSVANIR